MEKKYNVSIKGKAAKYLAKMGQPTGKRIADAIDRLTKNPYIGEALTNHEAAFRYRVGNYRILQDVYETELVISIVKIGPRGNVYN